MRHEHAEVFEPGWEVEVALGKPVLRDVQTVHGYVKKVGRSHLIVTMLQEVEIRLEDIDHVRRIKAKEQDAMAEIAPVHASLRELSTESLKEQR